MPKSFTEAALGLIFAVLVSLASMEARAVDLTKTALGQAAATLQPGQAVKFNTPTYQTIPMEGDQYYYGDSAVWNPVKQRIEYVAAAVTGSPRHYYLYDVATDQWSVDDTGLWAGNGHGFDSNAVDTVSGIHYFAKYGGPVVQRDDASGTWTALPATPFVLGTTPALEYLPGAGLVVASRNGNIAVWNGAAWTNIAGASAWGNTENWVSVVGDTAYIGVASIMYSLKKDATQDSGYKLTLMPAPPVPMGNSLALHTTDGTHLIVALKSGAMWYEFDGSAWKERPELVSGAVVNRWNYYVAYIPELQSIVTMSMRGTVREVWIVKTGAAISPPPPPPPVDCVPPSQYKPMCVVDTTPVRSRCDQPGVVICDDFVKVPAGFFYPGASMPYVENGMARFTLPAWCDNNCAGEYRVKFPDITAGGVFAWSFGVRADAQALSMEGLKRFIGYGPSDAPSCTSQQIVMTHMYAQQVPIMYRSCSIGIAPRLADGDVLFQQGDFDCRYRAAKVGNVAKCFTPKPGVWVDFYAELHVGHKGVNDTTYVMHVREDGGPWRKLYDVTYALASDAPFAVLALTPYGTNIVPSDHPTGRIDYRNLIVATKPLDLALL